MKCTATRSVLAAALLCSAAMIVNAQGSAASAASADSTRAVAMPGFMPWEAKLDLPLLPHEKHPKERPYPEYFTEALKLTPLATDDRFKSVRLRTTKGADPRYLVLPIQTQAFGFTPAFRAVIAAHLDHQLALRRIDGNRQTDVVDAYGPFTRRFSESALSDLTKQHPSSALLGLYLGHDGVAKTFLTLSITEGGSTQYAHRDAVLPIQPREAATALASLLPGMLDELRLGMVVAPTTPLAVNEVCKAQTWDLARHADEDRLALACHAIVVGSLMPQFEDRASYFPSPYTPAKLAWLATAFVEASEYPEATASTKSIQDFAWSQLQLGNTPAPSQDPVSSADPVVARLVKLIGASQRSNASPVRSAKDATQRYVEEAAKDLPPFIQAAFIERGNYHDALRRVDLCGMERELPGTMVSASCREDNAPAAPATRSATASETALYQEWRLAAFHKDIRYYGRTLGQAQQLNQLLATLPNDVARHPFVRQQRFQVEKTEASQGSFDAYLEKIRNAATAFVQSTADVQRFDAVLAGHSLSEHTWVQNTNVLNDKAISQLMDDEQRLIMVLRFDRFASAMLPEARRVNGAPAVFLYSGSVRQAIAQENIQAAMAAASSAQGNRRIVVPLPLPQAALQQPILFGGLGLQPQPLTEAQLQERIAKFPTDMHSRVALAIQMLKAGQPEADALRIIDAQPQNNRVDAQVGQSHLWATPAHAFFFAGDLANAKKYYQRVRDIGTGSDSDMHARVRINLIDGDIPSALAATDLRLKRYENDFARRDLASMLFMTSQPEPAWSLLTPRLASATTFQLWVGAFVGQRSEHKSLSEVKQWIDRQGLGSAQINYQDSAAAYQHLYAVIDRIPSDSDISLLQGSSSNLYRSAPWVASAQLMQSALQNNHSPEAFASVRKLLPPDPQRNSFMRPLFAWVAWHATTGKDPELEAMQKVELSSNDFDSLLAKSMLLALQGRTPESLEFLRAARYQMAELGLGSANVDRPIPSPYQYALAGYLMFRETSNDAYRTESLRFAQAHQHVFPFWAWAYALEALLLDPTDKSRAMAICRARYLDSDSYFLSLVKTPPKLQPAACGKKLWPSKP